MPTTKMNNKILLNRLLDFSITLETSAKLQLFLKEQLIINYGAILFENIFYFRIKLVRDLVDLIPLPALLALQPDFSAHP